MNNKEILEKVIKKAEENGWISPTSDSIEWFNFEAIIFGHDFAKAFWGNESHNYETGCEGFCWNHNFRCGADPYTKTEYCWQHQLHQMVLCEEPLKYLEKFLC